MKLLIAGIGNIFLGDDAFGVEVVRRLSAQEWTSGITVRDYGIRGLDLAYALMDDFDAFILVDACPRGNVPGTLYTIEIDPDSVDGELNFDGHSLHPLKVLQMVKAMGGRPTRVLLLGCEPETFGDEEDGHMGLSASVDASLNCAVSMVQELVNKLEAEHGQRKTLEDHGDYGSRMLDASVIAGH